MSSLYITEQGSSVHLKSNQLEIHKKDDIKKLPTSSITTLMLFGGVHITSNALNYLTKNGSDIAFLTKNGNFKSRVSSHTSKNIPIKLKQYELYSDKERSLSYAKKIVTLKMENSLAVLDKYSNNSHHSYKLTGKKRQSFYTIFGKVVLAKSLDSLRGYEGAFANIYFSEYSSLFTSENIKFSKREFHPANDPVNALLSLGYSFITREIESLCEAQGLDSHLGYFHTSTYGRVSLALDLVEPFRQSLVDSMVVNLINRADFTINDFENSHSGDGLYLTRDGMSKFIRIYERTVNKDSSNKSYRKQFRDAVTDYIHYLKGVGRYETSSNF